MIFTPIAKKTGKLAFPVFFFLQRALVSLKGNPKKTLGKSKKKKLEGIIITIIIRKFDWKLSPSFCGKVEDTDPPASQEETRSTESPKIFIFSKISSKTKTFFHLFGFILTLADGKAGRRSKIRSSATKLGSQVLEGDSLGTLVVRLGLVELPAGARVVLDQDLVGQLDEETLVEEHLDLGV